MFSDAEPRLTARAYRRLAKRVAETFGQDEAQVRRDWVIPLKLRPGDVVLDVGAGPGSTAEAWATLAVRAVSLDLDPVMLKASRGPRVVGDACALPIRDRTMDGVFAQGLLHVVGDVPRFLSECERVVKPGGWVVIANKGLAPWRTETPWFSDAVALLGINAIAWPPLHLLPATATQVSVRWTMDDAFFALRWRRAKDDD